MFNIADLMSQAKVMKEKMEADREKLAIHEYIGKAGGNLVVVTLNGKGEIKSLQIDPSIINAQEKGILEDLIVTAHNEAKHKVDNAAASLMSGMMEGMSLPPGFKLPF
ncbi:MAG: YbaB/EbfC family nucleoid-associated protein [Pseudomonadota bacterium]